MEVDESQQRNVYGSLIDPEESENSVAVEQQTSPSTM